MAADEDTGRSEGTWIDMTGSSPLSQEGEQEYWSHVKRALTDVFSVDGQAAERKVKDLQDKLRSRAGHEAHAPNDSGGTVTIFYHASPLDVAADLAGLPRDHVIQPEQRRRYIEGMSQAGTDRPDWADLAKLHPED